MTASGFTQIEALGGGRSFGDIVRDRLDCSQIGELQHERTQGLGIFVGSLDVFRTLGDPAKQAEPGVNARSTLRSRFVDRIVQANRRGTTVLVIGYWRSSLYIGPFWGGSDPGCPRCVLTRLEVSGVCNEVFDAGLVRIDDDVGPGLWGIAALQMAAELVKARVSDWYRGVGPGNSEVTLFQSHDGTAKSHVLIPDSMCALCGPAESSTYPCFEPRRDSLDRQFGHEGRLRQQSLGSIDIDHYVSPFGLLGSPRVDLQSPFGASSLELPSRLRPPEPAIGRARSYRESRVAAILEGLERFCGLHRGGQRSVTRASFRELKEKAICPSSMGTHPLSSHAGEAFPYREFADDIEVDWVEAYSFEHDGLRYVPERAAFWGPRTDGETSFFFETSNGCSLGSSVEEATLHGLRELIERDAFLLTWYRQLELPEIDLSQGRDPEVQALLRRCELFTGFRIRAFWSTMGFGMSSVWLVAINDHGSGPRVLAGGAAHPDPVKAIAGGLYELCGVVLATVHRYSSIRERSLEMLQDSDQIRQMEDHSNVGCLPEARERFSFLVDRDQKPVELSELMASSVKGSIRTHLDAVVQALRTHGIDVLVVDQTMPEVAAAGFRCVKVIAPGLLPMTFGHLNRRTMHLPRLFDGAALPYSSKLPIGAEVGHVPHPFP